MFVCMPVWLCVRAGVAVVSPGCRGALCAALSYVKLHLRPRLCLALLSVLSRGPAPPRPICRVLLIVDHNAVTPWPFSTTGKLIVLLPSHSRPVIQPMREQHGGFLLASPTKSFRLKKTHTRTHKHTHTLLIPWYQWQPVTTTHTLWRDTLQTHTFLSQRELEQTPTFFTPATAAVLVASGSGRHGDGSP